MTIAVDMGRKASKTTTTNRSIKVYVNYPSIINLFVCFDALRPKSTAMVIAGRSVHLTTLFPGQA